jgi:hypothetical protein
MRENTRSQTPQDLTGCYFFFLAWERSEAIGPRSLLGVFGSRRSFPACDAVFFEVGMKKTVRFPLHNCQYTCNFINNGR